MAIKLSHPVFNNQLSNGVSQHLKKVGADLKVKFELEFQTAVIDYLSMVDSQCVTLKVTVLEDDENIATPKVRTLAAMKELERLWLFLKEECGVVARLRSRDGTQPANPYFGILQEINTPTAKELFDEHQRIQALPAPQQTMLLQLIARDLSVQSPSRSSFC